LETREVGKEGKRERGKEGKRERGRINVIRDDLVEVALF